MAESATSPPPAEGTPPDAPAGWLWRVGMVIFLSGPAIVVGGDFYSRFASEPAPIEFPLGEPRDVAVDSRGRIYVAVDFYDRVQRYSAEGKFELGWRVPTSGTFSLRTTPDGRVLVATARGKKLLTYSGDGALLFEANYDWRKENLLHEFASETETTGHYSVHRGLFPRVADTRTGQTVIETPWPKWLLTAPLPAFTYGPIGFLLLLVADWRQKRSAQLAAAA